MQRNYRIYRESNLYNRAVAIDTALIAEMDEYLADPKIKKKFDYIVTRILDQNWIYYEDGYEDVTGYEAVGEMILFPGKRNGRIYCKEHSSPDGIFYVVAARLLVKKKDMASSLRIDEIFKTVSKYEY